MEITMKRNLKLTTWSAQDISVYTKKFLYPGLDPIVAAEKCKKFAEENLPFFLKIYEQRYVLNGAGNYYLGDHFSFADIWISVVLYNYCLNEKRKADFEQILKQYAPKVYDLLTRVREGELAEFFAKGYLHSAAA